ncbi:MAG: hypothetical protein ACP5DZ_06040 [Bacteroidales bacterium]
MMISMFSSYSRPFYQSSDIFELNPIEKSVYVGFIENMFRARNKNLDKALVEAYIDNYHCHTFYVQYFFNRLFEKSDKNVNKSDFEHVAEMILKERETDFYNFRNLLSDLQFRFLIALAKEGGTTQINAGSFIQKHKLSLPSSVNAAAKSLLEKEMIYKDKNTYMIYDVFFEKWLVKTF